MSVESVPIVIIGGGQAGLASGWCLRRAGLEPGRDFLIVDAAERSGGAWARMWPGLRLISPPRYSSLPGPAMPDPDDGDALTAADVVDYLQTYEDRVGLEVHRVPRRPAPPVGQRPAWCRGTSVGPGRGLDH